MGDSRDDITQLLRRMQEGDAGAQEAVLRLLYEELHREAVRAMRGQPPRHTLQATALLHEVWLKVADGAPREYVDRRHFLATASRAMRQVLIDHARAQRQLKREAPGEQQPLDRVVVSYEERALDLLALDEALGRMKAFDPLMAQAVELRFFGGATTEEAADVLGISARTLERRWSATRAWLRAELG